jgi:hypothetical protein
MGGDRLVVDNVFGDTVLVDTHGSKDVKGLGVDLCTTVRDNTDDDLLPGIRAPGAGAVAGGEMANVLHDTVHCSCEENLIFLLDLKRETNRVNRVKKEWFPFVVFHVCFAQWIE